MGQECQRCKSDRIMSVSGKCSDLFSAQYKDQEHNGYVLSEIGLNDDHAYGDYLQVDYCLECGQMQGSFPVPEAQVIARFQEG